MIVPIHWRIIAIMTTHYFTQATPWQWSDFEFTKATQYVVYLDWLCRVYCAYLEKIDHIIAELNTLRPRKYGRHFPDDICKRIFLNDNIRISINISLNLVPYGPIDYKSAIIWTNDGLVHWYIYACLSLRIYASLNLNEWTVLPNFILYLMVWLWSSGTIQTP